MKRPATILLIMLVGLMIEPLASRQAQNRPSQTADTGSAPRRTVDSSRSYPSLTVAFDEGSFKLTDLRLSSLGGSTRLNGKLINQTERLWPSLVFAVKAYDSRGRQLRGVESETIFAINRLAKDKAAAINSGYGVRLEGIPLSAVARLEVVLLEDESPAAHAGKRAPVFEIEE